MTLNLSEKLLDNDPNKLDVFLFNVLVFGIKVSSLSLKTVANLSSKYLLISSNFSFLYSNPAVKDLPVSKSLLNPTY